MEDLLAVLNITFEECDVFIYKVRYVDFSVKKSWYSIKTSKKVERLKLLGEIENFSSSSVI